MHAAKLIHSASLFFASNHPNPEAEDATTNVCKQRPKMLAHVVLAVMIVSPHTVTMEFVNQDVPCLST